ncbi:MAG: hypothetical protein Q7J25_10280 [Vicinamibacterales bacterium]|nr:hypothetical protein [Vicinamibacterales bacterium]
MNMMSPMFPTTPHRYQRGEERRRDTILVRERPMTAAERKKWFGGPAPAPVPETDKNWRPETIKF